MSVFFPLHITRKLSRSHLQAEENIMFWGLFVCLLFSLFSGPAYPEIFSHLQLLTHIFLLPSHFSPRNKDIVTGSTPWLKETLNPLAHTRTLLSVLKKGFGQFGPLIQSFVGGFSTERKTHSRSTYPIPPRAEGPSTWGWTQRLPKLSLTTLTGFGINPC